MRPTRRHADVAAVVLLAAAGAAAAAPGLRAGLWTDEASMASVANRSFADAQRLLDHADAGIAGYVLVLNRWAAAAGASEVALRLPSLVAGALTVVAGGLLARRVAGPVAGVVAAGLLALHPLLLPYYGVEARPYAASTAAVAVAALLAHRARDRGWWAALAWALAASAAIALHAMATLAVLPAALWVLRRRAPAVVALLPATTAAVMVAGALRFSEQQEWLPPLTLGSLVRDAAAVWSPAALAAGAAALVVLAHRGTRVRRPDPDHAVLALWAAGPLAALAVLSIVREPALMPRYVLSSAVAAAVLAGTAVQGALDRVTRVAPRRRPAQRAGALVAVAAVVALALVTGAARPAPKPDDLRAAATYIEGNAQPGDAVLYAPGWVEMGARWYLAERAAGPPDLAAASQSAAEAGGYWTPPTDEATILQRLASVRRVWLVGYPDEPPQAPEVQAATADALLACWQPTHTTWFGVGVQLLVRPSGPEATTCPARHLEESGGLVARAADPPAQSPVASSRP